MLKPIKRLFLFEEHTCPWWLAYTWDNGIRRYFHNTDLILKPYLNPGNTALDVGCGMGYFSIRMAEYVGEKGRVVSVDIQQKMLDVLEKRAEKKGVGNVVEPLLSRGDLGDIGARVDFALNFWMLHEVYQKETLVGQIYDLMNPGGRYLIADPRIHTGGKYFKSIVKMCKAIGFNVAAYPDISFSRSVLLSK